MDVVQQEPEHVLQTRVGSTVMTIRGTSFIMGYTQDGYMTAIMLSGIGEVALEAADGETREVELSAGAMMFVLDYEYELLPRFDVDRMDEFSLVEIYKRHVELLESGVLTREMLNRIIDLLDL